MCLPWLGCCVRLPGLCFLLFPVLSPTLAGMPCPPPWFCLSLVSGLVSQLASHVGWEAVSVFWVCLQNFICDLCNCLGSTVVLFFFLGVLLFFVVFCFVFFNCAKSFLVELWADKRMQKVDLGGGGEYIFYLCIYICTYIYIKLQISIYICKCICICICKCICKCICICICICKCICICICIFMCCLRFNGDLSNPHLYGWVLS